MRMRKGEDRPCARCVYVHAQKKELHIHWDCYSCSVSEQKPTYGIYLVKFTHIKIQQGNYHIQPVLKMTVRSPLKLFFL